MAGIDPSMKCWFSGTCPRANSEYCKTCHQKGMRYLAEVGFIPKSLIPLEYHFIEVLDMDIRGSALQVLKYLDDVWNLAEAGKGFYAYGKGTGTGKTTIGCIALRRYLFESLRRDPNDLDNRRVLYINTSEFLDRIRKSFNNQDLELEKLLEELTSVATAPGLILFDDIGAENCTEWVRERLYNLLNFRSSNGLASLFSSNHAPEELADRLGMRIYDRIMGSSKPIEFVGKSHRRCEW